MTVINQQFLSIMQKLLFSRKQRQGGLQKIDKLSPQKYGRSAYYELSFTPSKLADNILFREASNLKKIQEELSKRREYQYQNQILLEQVEYLKRERDGISTSLNKVITMYKQIIADMETKNQERIRETQTRFKEEFQKYIQSKEQEAKFYQSEKEILEQRIQQLESDIVKVKQELNRTNSLKSNIHHEYDQLAIKLDNTALRLKETEERAEIDAERAKKDYQRLTSQFMNAEVEWKNKTREEISKKDQQIENIERTNAATMEKIQNQHSSENSQKDHEMEKKTKQFDCEVSRLKQILFIKDQMISQLTQENSKEKTRVLTLTRQYQTEIGHLSLQKNRLLEEIEIYAQDNEVLVRDKTQMTDDLQRENIKLRDLLYQSSMELERCKNELISLAKDNTRLVNRVKSSQQQAKTWRDSYYINKTRPI